MNAGAKPYVVFIRLQPSWFPLTSRIFTYRNGSLEQAIGAAFLDILPRLVRHVRGEQDHGPAGTMETFATTSQPIGLVIASSTRAKAGLSRDTHHNASDHC